MVPLAGSPPSHCLAVQGEARYVESLRPVNIAVLTATRNCVTLIDSLIESLHQQTDGDFTWIVADSRSTDGTLDRIRQCGLLDVRVTSEPDFSIYDALNRALRICTSNYYLVIGADDLLEPHAIAGFRQAAAQSAADLIVAPVKTFGMLRMPLAGQCWLRGGNGITASHSVGTLIRRDLHEQVGYYSNRYVSAADMQFILKVARDPLFRVEAVSFVAGTFSNDGLSSTDELLSLSDFFRLQIANSENVVLQSVLYMLRLTRAVWRGHRARR